MSAINLSLKSRWRIEQLGIERRYPGSQKFQIFYSTISSLSTMRTTWKMTISSILPKTQMHRDWCKLEPRYSPECLAPCPSCLLYEKPCNFHMTRQIQASLFCQSETLMHGPTLQSSLQSMRKDFLNTGRLLCETEVLSEYERI